MGRRGLFAAMFVVMMSAAAVKVSAQDFNAAVWVPSFDVRLSLGFNYDLLRPLTGVDFTRPMGYLGLNVPIPIGANLQDLLGDDVFDELFSDDMFRRPDNFRPNANARQNANYTVRVDVPMLGGVGSFGYTQNFFFNFNTALGGSNVINAFQDVGERFDEDKDEGAGEMSGYISLKGALRIPLSLALGWETMTFGYAYRVNNDDNLIFALNLHRHLFSANMRMRADIDLLGHVKIDARDVEINDDGVTTNLSVDEELFNFHSGVCNGSANARYRAEAWTPSVGVKWWRFSLNSRFGLDVRARGTASGGFRVPQIVNIETGDIETLDKFDGFADSIANNPLYALEMLSEDGGVIPRDLDSVTYVVNSDRAFRWKMPQGHTIGFDIIPDRFTVSYTKLFGEVNLHITDIVRTTKPELSEDHPRWLGEDNDTLKVDLGVKIDHIFMLQLTYPSFFMSAGICGVDVRSGSKHALGDVGLRLGDVSMLLPVLSGGVNLGTKLQLRLEADILPLPAVRTGVNYYF